MLIYNLHTGGFLHTDGLFTIFILDFILIHPNRTFKTYCTMSTDIQLVTESKMRVYT